MCHHVPCAIPYYTFGRSTVVLRQSEVSAGGQPLKLRYLNPLSLSKGSYMMSFAAVALCLLGMCRCSVAYSVTSLKTTKSFQLHIQPSDTYGENNFGDIMGGCETSVSILGSFTSMERVILSANGNLQRIMSAYYGAPVFVQVLKCDPIGPMEFHREVNLLVNNQVFCTAIGNIELYSDDCKKAIEERNIGVGQLFRFLGVLPSFNLLGAGRNSDGELWREYELSCPQVRCRFVETFINGFLDDLSESSTPNRDDDKPN